MRFTERFPWGFGGGWVPDEPAPKDGTGLIELLRASPETRDLPFDEEPYQTALQMAEFLDGMPRYPKMHPCGLVLSRQPMHELTPTFVANKGYSTTHFDMDAVEAIGLVKMDILAQGGLAAMRDVKGMLAKRGIEVDLQSCTARMTKDNPPPLPPGSHPLHELVANQPTPDPSQEGNWPTVGERAFVSVPLPGGARGGFMVPMHAQMREEAFHELSEAPPGFGVRQSSGALAMEASQPKAPGDWRSPRRYRAIRRFRPSDTPSPTGGEGRGEGEPWQDPQVWEMIASGGARAVHHIESPAMTSLCRMCNVREIDGLIAVVSVIRPGAADEGKKLAFARRYQGMEPVAYPHPSLESCLRSTYGLVVYEEHILQLSESFAGLPPC